MRLILLLLLASIIIAPASAGDYYKVWDEANKTVTIYKQPADKWMTVKLMESTPDITTFTETFQISSNYNYAFSDLVDFKLRNQKVKGAHGIDTVSWYILQNVTVNTTVNDYTPVNHSEYNETNQTWNNWTEYVLSGNHTVTSYKDVWQSFSGNGNIKKDQTLYFKMIAKKKAETGAFSIQTIPMFMGLEESNLTWWNGSWAKKKPVLLNNTGNATTFTYHQVNNNVTYDGDMNNDFSDVRFINDTDNTEQPYWIESQVNGSYANLWVNFSSVPASVWTNSTYYLYYSNPSATYNNTIGLQNTFIREIDSGQPVNGSWTLDDNAQDTSGNNNHGTLNGGMGYTAGKFGQAGQFDGSNDYVNYGNVINQGTNDFSISAWVKTSYTPSGVIGLIVIKESSAPGYQFGIRQSGVPYAFIKDAGGQLGTTDDGIVINNSVWHHYVAVFDRDGNLIRYVDGQQTGTADIISARSGSLSNSNNLQIGQYNADTQYNFNGTIDEVRIYNRALTQAEITDIYNNYGYTTTNYPGRELVRKYASPEPSAETGAEEANTVARTQVIIIN